MNEKVTIYDIAKKLKTSAATVSRALNNNPNISESMRQLVFETAKKMNYKQNKLALALKSGKSNNVGVIVPYIDRSFFSSIIRGIEDELYPRGYRVIISQTHETEQKEIDTINMLLNAQVDGILMSVSKFTATNSHFKRVLDNNIPLVFFDRRYKMKGVSSVVIDDFQGGFDATNHLIKLGCKHIAHISGDMSLEIYRNRYEGYKTAIEDAGLEFNPTYVIESKNDIEAGQTAVDFLLNLETPPNAIFSSSDYVALGVIQKLKERGFNVPQDFCVVGFSNEPFTKFMELTMSTVDQCTVEMGKMAALVFLEQVKNSKIKIEKKVQLSPQLIIRGSSSKKL
ncbi:LacI family DNA-binding transcriptional regulator [uncultured Formosa sp.]|uniref:LacI family DNA-binding transcriptional regulator n=1 Tax=uncultured Formosa sp. TaxID=255435 RepID=UPI002625DBC1|nr:LacI family DNA-binding transcriptional regulator [uncultured Formosa sp.]